MAGGLNPAYKKLIFNELSAKVTAAQQMLENCNLCPHKCGVDRTAGQMGKCNTGVQPLVASYGPHIGEEPPLTGTGGSGTIFFGNCNLNCIFCQNHDISQGGKFEVMSTERLSGIMLGLKEMGCHNINLVSPTHQMPMILVALLEASSLGLDLPVVYNCGGYESLEALEILDGVVDIYLPDFKFSSSNMATMLCGAKDYPMHAKAAIKEMYRQVGNLQKDSFGVAMRGLIIRHLVLPGKLSGSEEVLKFISSEISPEVYLNIMDQYQPCHLALSRPPLDRSITPQEYQETLDLAAAYGLTNLA